MKSTCPLATNEMIACECVVLKYIMCGRIGAVPDKDVLRRLKTARGPTGIPLLGGLDGHDIAIKRDMRSVDAFECVNFQPAESETP